MDYSQQIQIAGALNAPAFVSTANSLSGGTVIDFQGAVDFFNEMAKDNGIAALQQVFEDIPVTSGPAPTGNNYKFLGPNAMGNIWDALSVLMGGASQGEIEAYQAALQAQQTQQSESDKVNPWLIGGIVGGGVLLVLLLK